jgi:hypothetical protein
MRLVLVILICGSLSAKAATINAASVERADVQTALNTAVTGDTVVIPGGTSAAYSASLTNYNKGLTVVGTTNNPTPTILNLGSLTFGNHGYIVNMEHGTTNRIFGIIWSNSVFGVSAIQANGSNGTARIRIATNRFVGMAAWSFDINGAIGVYDHNYVAGGSQVPVAYVHHANFDGGAYGDKSYAASNLFGTDQFMFFEDNIIHNQWSGHLTTIDGFGGSRYVFRYNELSKGSLEFHGTESGGRSRGGRAVEVYMNTFTGNDSAGTVTYFRSGVGVIWSNSVSGYAAENNPLKILNVRNDNSHAPFSPGNAEASGATGFNPWDDNNPAGPYETGSASSGGTLTMTVSGTPWSTDQWRGYTLNRTSGKTISSLTRSGSAATATCTAHGFSNEWKISIVGAAQDQWNGMSISITVVDANTFTFTLPFGATPTTPATGSPVAMRGNAFSEITANTANTITFRAATQTSDTDQNYYDLNFSSGETYKIGKVTHSLDQPGRWGGSIVSGDTPTRPWTTNDQVTFPWYQWNNTREGLTAIGFSAGHLTIRAGEHYTNATLSGYVPYTYPHPLVSADIPAVSTSPRGFNGLRMLAR